MELPSIEPPSRLKELEKLKTQMQENFHSYTEVQNLPPADRDALFDLLFEAQNGSPDVLKDIYSLVYDEIPVDMEEFLLSRRYMNLGGGLINQEKIELLVHFDKPNVRKVWCAAGSGSGKSFMVSLVISRTVYLVMCLKRPDLFYMLGPKSKMAAINLSVGKEQAKDVIFSEFLARLEHSSFFRGKYHALTSKATFPKRMHVFSGGSGKTAYFGYNTIMGSLDEASHMLDKSEKSVAEDLIEAMLKSLNTRFPTSYKLFVISTLRAPDDFLNTNIERIRDSGVCLVNRPLNVD